MRLNNKRTIYITLLPGHFLLHATKTKEILNGKLHFLCSVSQILQIGKKEKPYKNMESIYIALLRAT